MNHINGNDSFLEMIGKAFYYIFSSAYSTTIGLLFTFLQYLFPIRNVVHLLITFFILDVLFGYMAARKLRKEKFSVKIIWSHTMPRMLISIVLITCAFMWDEVYQQEWISTYKIIGWFISGVLLSSIAENAYLITKWAVFPKIDKIIRDKTDKIMNDDK